MIDRVTRALAYARGYAGFDGAHHKQWVIDQMVRALTDSSYEDWVTMYEMDENGNRVYEWDTGVAP